MALMRHEMNGIVLHGVRSCLATFLRRKLGRAGVTGDGSHSLYIYGGG